MQWRFCISPRPQVLKVFHLSYATTSTVISSSFLLFLPIPCTPQLYLASVYQLEFSFFQVLFVPLLELHNPLGLPAAVRDEEVKGRGAKSEIFLIIYRKSLLFGFSAEKLSSRKSNTLIKQHPETTRSPRYSPVGGRSQSCRLITQPTRKTAASSQNTSKEKNNKRQSGGIEN